MGNEGAEKSHTRKTTDCQISGYNFKISNANSFDFFPILKFSYICNDTNTHNMTHQLHIIFKVTLPFKKPSHAKTIHYNNGTWPWEINFADAR